MVPRPLDRSGVEVQGEAGGEQNLTRTPGGVSGKQRGGVSGPVSGTVSDPLPAFGGGRSRLYVSLREGSPAAPAGRTTTPGAHGRSTARHAAGGRLES